MSSDRGPLYDICTVETCREGDLGINQGFHFNQ